MATNLYRLALSHYTPAVPGVRNRFEWDRDSVREIFHFGKWIVLGTAFYFFASQADRLILGKVVSLTVLGIYGIAFSLSDIPRSIINAFSYKVGYPFVAKIIHLPLPNFARNSCATAATRSLVGAVLLAAMVTWGDLLVLTKLYKPAYHEGAWMVPILAVGLWHTLLYMTTGPVLFSLGKSKYNAFGNGAYCLAVLTGIPLAFHFYGSAGRGDRGRRGRLPALPRHAVRRRARRRPPAPPGPAADGWSSWRCSPPASVSPCPLG